MKNKVLVLSKRNQMQTQDKTSKNVVSSTTNWPIVDNLIYHCASKYANQIGIHTNEFSQLTNVSIPVTIPINQSKSSWNHDCTGNDIYSLIDPWDIHPWIKEKINGETIYTNTLTGQMQTRTPSPIFKRKIEALSKLTPRKCNDSDIFIHDKYIWREEATDKRRRQRYEQKIKKAKEKEIKRRQCEPNEYEQIIDVMQNIVDTIDDTFHQQQKRKIHRDRKLVRQKYHPCTKGYEMKRLCPNEIKKKNNNLNNLVTDLPIRDVFINSNGQLLPQKIDVDFIDTKRNEKPNETCTKNNSNFNDSIKVTITFQFKPPSTYEKFVISEINEKDKQSEKYVLDTSKQINFWNALINEISLLTHLPKRNIIVNEMTSYDIRDDIILNGTILSQSMNHIKSIDTLQGQIYSNLQKQNTKNNEWNTLNISSNPYQTTKNFNTVKQMIQHFKLSNKKIKHYSCKVINQHKKNGSTCYTIETSNHDRCSISFFLMSCSNTSSLDASTRLIRYLSTKDNSNSILSYAINWSEENVSKSKIFDRWETYWSHIIHPCYFGYTTKKRYTANNVPKQDKIQMASKEGNIHPSMFETQAFKSKKSSITKDKFSNIGDMNVDNCDDKKSMYQTVANDTRVQFNPISFLSSAILKKSRPEQLYHIKKRKPPLDEINMMNYLTFETSKHDNDWKVYIRTKAYQQTKLKVKKPIFTYEIGEEAFQFLRTRIHKQIPKQKECLHDSISIENIYIFLEFNKLSISSPSVIKIMNETAMKQLFINQPTKKYGYIQKDEFIMFWKCLFQIVSHLDHSSKKKNLIASNINDNFLPVRFNSDEAQKCISISMPTKCERSDTKSHKRSSHIMKPTTDEYYDIYLDIVSLCEHHCPTISRFIYKNMLQYKNGYSFLCRTFDPSDGCDYVVQFRTFTDKNHLDSIFDEVFKLLMTNHESLVNISHVKSTQIHNQHFLLIIVMEWCSGGSILEYLQSTSISNEKRNELMIYWSMQILNAINKIHSLGLIHGNINANNVYLDSYGKAKLGSYFCCKSTHYIDGITNETSHELEGEKLISQLRDLSAYGHCLLYWLTGSVIDLEHYTIEDILETIPLYFHNGFRDVITLALEENPNKCLSAQMLYDKLYHDFK